MLDPVKDLIRRLVSENVFGGSELVSLDVDSGTSLAPQFQGEVIMMDLKVRTKSGDLKLLPIVIKKQYEGQAERSPRDPNVFFSNEVAMYNEILPSIDVKKRGKYPKIYYALATKGNDPRKDVLVMENFSTSGFETARNDLFFDFNHMVLALKKLGEFHSWSYSMKSLDQKRFGELTEKIKPLKRQGDIEYSESLLVASIKRGIQPILDKGIEEKNLRKFLEISQLAFKVMDFLCEPCEPFAVIIHGDYNRNNLFFKYDKSGKPVDCAYFDFQFSRYSTPVGDLSFLLYMQTTEELRRKHWDHFLQIYWTSVEENLENKADLPKFEDFKEYFSKKAVLSYFATSFFLPMMYAEEKPSREELAALSKEDKRHMFLTIGGEKGTQLLTDIVNHFIEKKYLHAFLDYFQEKHSIH